MHCNVLLFIYNESTDRVMKVPPPVFRGLPPPERLLFSSFHCFVLIKRTCSHTAGHHSEMIQEVIWNWCYWGHMVWSQVSFSSCEVSSLSSFTVTCPSLTHLQMSLARSGSRPVNCLHGCDVTVNTCVLLGFMAKVTRSVTCFGLFTLNNKLWIRKRSDVWIKHFVTSPCLC